MHFRQKAGFQAIFVKWQDKNIFVGKQDFFRQKAAPPGGMKSEKGEERILSPRGGKKDESPPLLPPAGSDQRRVSFFGLLGFRSSSFFLPPTGILFPPFSPAPFRPRDRRGGRRLPVDASLPPFLDPHRERPSSFHLFLPISPSFVWRQSVKGKKEKEEME